MGYVAASMFFSLLSLGIAYKIKAISGGSAALYLSRALLAVSLILSASYLWMCGI